MQWESKINELRDGELTGQWSVFCWNSLLMSIYLLTPIVLSTVVLTTYSVVHGGLSPATAFTAISILNTMQGSLSAMPGVISRYLNCVISARRVHEYLSMPERASAVRPSATIEFQNATFAWPGHRGDTEDGILRGVTFQVPSQGLTLITGPTGTGKSLLLAAMLGECDISRGVIKAPTQRDWNSSPSEHEWLTDSTIAYVSQNPWIVHVNGSTVSHSETFAKENVDRKETCEVKAKLISSQTAEKKRMLQSCALMTLRLRNSKENSCKMKDARRAQ